MIRIEALVARAGKTEILRGVDMAVGAGEFVALVGPNGAGKTTLLKHLNGLRSPSEGRVVVAGMDTRRARTSELAGAVGFLFQNPDHQIIAKTVAEEIEFGLRHTGVPRGEREERIVEAAESVGLSGVLAADPFSLSRPLRQRVALASVLALRPRVLVLDEPTSSQDERAATRVMELASELNRRGTTVILVCHDMELVARYARRVIVLVDGKVASDRGVHETFLDDALLVGSGLAKPGAYRLAAALGLEGEGEALSAERIAEAVEAMLRRVTA